VRTNIEIDDELMRRAMRASGERTKRVAVERALRLLVDTLHCARGFDPFEKELGLRVVHAETA
jgi:hypothetical protein